MKAITQRESVVTYIKSCLIFQIPRFTPISKYRVISPLSLDLDSCFWLKVKKVNCSTLKQVHSHF